MSESLLPLYNSLLPSWAAGLELPLCASKEDKVSFALSLAGKNVDEQTGGPFGAALFDTWGRAISIGVNRVIPLKNAFFHAEIVCLLGALERLKTPTLTEAYTLAVSAQPCAMCTGALVWGGVRELLFSVSASENHAITGFDEGPIHPEWRDELEQRGIQVCEGIHVEEGRELLSRYARQGGFIYNGSCRR